MDYKSKELLALLAEVRDACAIAVLPEDNNLNLIIEEIDRLTSLCISRITGN